MLIGAKKLTMANDAFAPRLIYAALDAAHHIFARQILRLVILLDVARTAFEKTINNPEPKSKKYQLIQTSPAPSVKAPL